MANTKSAKKAVRTIETQTANNKSRRTRMRSEIRLVEEAITSGDHSAAIEALKSAQTVIARTAQKGVVHKKTASRKISRLNARVKVLAK